MRRYPELLIKTISKVDHLDARCSSNLCKRGFRIFGPVDVFPCLMPMRSAVSLDFNWCFLLTASSKNFRLLFSCPVTAQSDVKVFRIASSILKAISHALTGQFFW